MSDYMTETLEQIKQTIAEAHEQGISNWNTSTISSLITTIESQKEEITKEREYVTIKQKQLWSAIAEIESLKAITELAVKGLKEIKSMEFYEGAATPEQRIAIHTLSEIERLQNEQI